MATVVAFNKPYGVLSQFRDADGHPGLAHYLDIAGIYPAGRLDRDSEGLLLLTDDGQLQARISHPRYKLPKTYWVQVEGAPSAVQLRQLSQGVLLNDGLSQPAKVAAIAMPRLWPRTPPVRFRENQPTCWLEITLREGRNRQVRRMTAAVGLPTLRLVRSAIGRWRLGDLQPGEFRVDSIHLPKQNPGKSRK